MTIAASFDTDAARMWGAAQGDEFYRKGAHVQLGPGINVARIPLNGRNFEYISGEDPVLGARMVAPAIRGIQSQGVVANAKHWVQNNQEENRGSVNELVDERTRFEYYYPPFEAAVRAGVGSFMCSYNRINGNWSCENSGRSRSTIYTYFTYILLCIHISIHAYIHARTHTYTLSLLDVYTLFLSLHFISLSLCLTPLFSALSFCAVTVWPFASLYLALRLFQ